MNQQLTFLSDGGDTVRDLQLYLSPEAEHLLDWFHVAMRLTVLQQTAKGLQAYVSPEARSPSHRGLAVRDSWAAACATRPPSRHRKHQRGRHNAAGETMTGAAGRQRFEARLLQDVMDRLCQPCGVIARRRTRPRGMVGRAMVMSAGTPGGAYQADVGRAYLECAGPRVTGAACERWFDQPRAAGLAAREQDSRPLQRADAWRGEGWLADWAAARLARRRACDADAVRGVSRRPAHWQPTGDDSARGPLSPEGLPGTDREARLEAEPLVRDGRTLDADVPLGGTPPPLHRRRVGVPPSTGDGFGRTPRPPRLGPRQVAARDRVRWEGDRRLRLDPSGPRLDAVATAPPGALKTRLEAALLASPRAALLAHTQHLQTRPSPTGSPRTAAPRHPRRLALPWAVSCQASAEACPRHAVVAKRRWEKIAAWLTPAGKDPHGRRRPSLLAQFRGWKRQPVVRKHTNPRHVQAAASVDACGHPVSWLCHLL